MASRRGVIAGGAALAFANSAPALSSVWTRLREPLGILDRTGTPGSVALTFDDGPHPRGTPATLELLAEAKVTATFFLVGEQVRRRPSLVGEIVAGGHEVGIHCERHRNLLRLGPGQVREDLRRAHAVISDAAQRPLRLYRAPYGVFSASALAYARLHGWLPLLWTHWGRDWEQRATVASIARRVTDGLEAGDVLLLHDADYYSAAESHVRMLGALPRVLELVVQRGLRFGMIDGAGV